MWPVKTLLLVLALATAACAGSNAQRTDVRIVFTQAPPELPFDPEDARLRAAQAQLAQLVGHPLVFDIDAALLPQWRGSFRHLLVEAIENVARDVRQLEEREPQAIVAQLASLTRIECRYVATRPSRRSELSADGTTLKVFTTAEDRELVPAGMVLGHVIRAFAQAQKEKFGRQNASSVRQGELAAYFRDLSLRHDRGEGSLAESVRADAIASMIELDARASGELRVTIRHWLAGSGAQFFSRAYVHQGAAVKSYPLGSRFRTAERAFAKWVNATQKALPEDDRLTLLKELYPRGFTQNREPGRSFVSFAFPGMDRDAILFDVIDEWIAAGHPMPSYGSARNGKSIAPAGPKPKPLHEYVLCPRPKSPEGQRSLGPHCDDTLYLRALEEPSVAARLNQTLLAKKDALLTETVFANLARSSRVELAIAAWTQLGDANDAGWRIAATVMAEELAAHGAPELLVSEARRLYRTRERDRGIALYVLALSNRHANGKLDWASFPKTDSPIRASDLTAFLQAGPHGVALLPVIWPALDSNVKRADLFLPEYDAFLAAAETRQYDMQDPWKTLRTIHASLCREGKLAEVASIRRYYDARRRVDPEHATIYVDFASETSPARCQQEAAHHQRARRMDADIARRRAGDR